LRAGDTVFIDKVRIRNHCRPIRTADDYITYARYNSEQATITGVSDGVDLRGKSYIVVDGIRIVTVSNSWVNMRASNTSHNTIRNCYMEEARGWGGIYMGDATVGAEYNKILNNTLKSKCTGTDPTTAVGP
jgi:hypothetical protein